MMNIHLKKIPSILVTNDVLKLVKSTEINDEYRLNIFVIYLTVVLKLNKSNEINGEQPKNIDSINLAYEVLKVDKFNALKEEHL